MKTMNEIKSPCDGTVSRILAQPGDMVEYNQTVAIIEWDAVPFIYGMRFQ